MVKPLFFIVSSCIVLISCNNPSINTVSTNTTPKALQENESYTDIVKSVRYDNDVLEQIYDELKEKNTELKLIDEKISLLNNSQNDSLKSFANFDQKNVNFYNMAKSYTTRISDSVLMKKMSHIIEESSNRYHIKINKLNNLKELIEAKTIILNDLQTVLKITKTLAVIEKYQNNQLPNQKSMNSLLLEIQNTISKVNVEINKK